MYGLAAIRFLNLARLREHPLRTVLTVVAIGAGVALFVAVLVARASMLSALDSFDRQRSGPATLQVAGSGTPAGLDEDVLAQVDAVDGVAAAVPLVQAVTIAEDRSGQQTFVVALGVDCRIEAIVGDIGCATPASPLPVDGPVLAPALREVLGSGGVVRSDRGRIAVGDAPTLDLLDALNHGRVAVFPLAQAQEVFTRVDALDTILVVPDRGVGEDELQPRLQEAVGAHNQVGRTGDWGIADHPMLPMLFLVGVLSLVLGGQLAFNAITLSLEERRHDLAVSGALGASRRLLLAGTLVETGLLGLAGGAVGVAAGGLAAAPLVDSMSKDVERSTGVQVGVALPPGVVAVGLALGIGVALLATVRPARRAARADVAAELQARGSARPVVPPRRLGRGTVFFVLGLVGMAAVWLGQRDGALEPWQWWTAQTGFVVVILCWLRAVFYLAAPVLAAVTRLLPRLRRGMTGVALDNLVGDPQRTGTMTLVVAVAVTVGVFLGSMREVIPAGAALYVGRSAPGTVEVGPGLQTNTVSLAARPSPEVRRRLEAMPGVAAVTGSYVVDVHHPLLGDQEVMTKARDGAPPSEFPIVRGDSAGEVLRRGEAILGLTVARSYGLDVGDRFTIPGRNGVITVRVGAIVLEDGDLGESVTMPYDQFVRLHGRHAPSILLVTPEPGVSITDLAGRIRAELHTLDPDLTALAPDELAQGAARDVRSFLGPFWALQRSLMLVAFVAALSTLLLVGLERRREYGLLAAVGLAPSSLGRMVLVEAGVVGVLGTALGAVVGTAALVVAGLTGPLVLGLSAPFRFDLTAPLLYGALTTACVVAGAALPARRAARLDPATALRYE